MIVDMKVFAAAFAATCCVVLAAAQDTRKVVEPSIPPACATLEARIGRAAGSIAPEDEGKLDTARIQAALDACPAGRAVALERASERTDAFLSGPLELRRGVALVVARGAYLFASRNPRDYDLSRASAARSPRKAMAARRCSTAIVSPMQG